MAGRGHAEKQHPGAPPAPGHRTASASCRDSLVRRENVRTNRIADTKACCSRSAPQQGRIFQMTLLQSSKYECLVNAALSRPTPPNSPESLPPSTRGTRLSCVTPPPERGRSPPAAPPSVNMVWGIAESLRRLNRCGPGRSAVRRWRCQDAPHSGLDPSSALHGKFDWPYSGNQIHSYYGPLYRTRR